MTAGPPRHRPRRAPRLRARRPRLPAGPRHQRRAPARRGPGLRRAALAAGQVPLRLLPGRRRRGRAHRRQGRPRRRAGAAARHVPPARQGRDRADRPRRRRRASAPPPAGAFADPRASRPRLARLRRRPGGVARRHRAARRRRRCRRGAIALGVPETGVELVPDDSYILEMGFERLHGVDFRKGCYVGQEVTARMKHKTELRKGLARVRVDGAAAAARHRDPRRRQGGRHAPHRRRTARASPTSASTAPRASSTAGGGADQPRPWRLDALPDGRSGLQPFGAKRGRRH